MGKQSSLSVSTAWYGIGNFFIRSISFLLIPLYTNFLTPGEYGNYALLMSLYSLAAVIYQSNMQTGLTKFYLESGEIKHREKIFSTVFNSVVLLGFTISLIAIIFSKNISALVLGSSGSRNLIIILFSSLFVENVGYFALHLLKTKELSRKAVTFSGINSVLNLLLNILFVYFMNLKVEGILWAQLISSAVMLFFLLPVVVPELHFEIDKAYFKKIIIFSLPLLISGILSSGIDVSDRFILDYFTGKAEVGIYSLAYKIALVMNVFVISFRTAWTPYGLNLYYKNNLAETFGITLKKLLAAGLLIFLAVTFFAPFLFDIKILHFNFLNKSYQDGLVILPLVLIGYLFSGIASFYSIYPIASAKSHHFLISDGLGFILNFLLNILLIPSYGMLGAAVATCSAFAAVAAYLIVISNKKTKVNYPIKDILFIILAAAVAYLAGMVYRNLIFELTLICIYLVVIIYSAGIKLTGIFKTS